MNMHGLRIGTQKLGEMLNRNSPTILTGLAVTGLITTAVLAVRATPKALELLEDEREYRLEKDEPSMTKVDMAKTVWKCYLPATLMGMASIGCIIGANSINLRRNAALASVYSITEATLREYQEKVVETIGKKKEEQIRGDIAQDRLEADPISEKSVITTGRGSVLCYDSLSARYFLSDIEFLRKVQNDFNRDLLHDRYRTLNELYSEMGLEENVLGRDLGWDAERMLEFRFSSKLAADGRPCLVIDYTVVPRKL